MALAEHTPTAANDAEPTGAAPAPSPAPAPAPATSTPPVDADPADLDARADALRASQMGASRAPWADLHHASQAYWRDRARFDAKGLTPPPPPASSSVSDPPAPPKSSTHVVEAVHDIPEKVDPLLVSILSWPRRHGSWSELAFCKWLRMHIDGLGAKPVIVAEGCILVSINPPDRQEGKVTIHPKPATTLFSCHVDTIEGSGADVAPPAGDGEPVVLRKKLTYDPNFGQIALDKDSIGGSLGADDGAGVYVMLKMIEAKVPGTYLFHRGEECGGIGSAAMRDKYKDALSGFEAAVAFDRHDTFEVIYHQGGMKCASLKFTEALCAALNKQGFKYSPSTRGVFTDTKNYRKIIPECVNIAVGYQSQHGRNETLDYAHLAALAKAACAIEWEALPIDRDPTEADYSGYSTGYGRGSYGSGRFDDADDAAWAFPQGGSTAKTTGKKKSKKKQAQQAQQPLLESGPALSCSAELAMCSLEDIEAWCEDSPLDAAKAIGQLLLEIAALRATNEMLLKLMGWQEDTK